jgi:hypothetical protein
MEKSEKKSRCLKKINVALYFLKHLPFAAAKLCSGTLTSKTTKNFLVGLYM